MDNNKLEKFKGCLLGLALGDAFGAPFEGGVLERLLWSCVGSTKDGKRRWTDDTQMSLDLAESLNELGGVDPDDLAQRFAASYRWSRGYGPGAAKLLKRIAAGQDWRQANKSIFKDGSFGNGGAMRAPVIGVFYAEHADKLVEAARLSASVTHAHPLGLEGAVLIAAAVAKAFSSPSSLGILQVAHSQCELDPFKNKLEQGISWVRAAEHPSVKVVRDSLGNGIAATESCAAAVYDAARFLGKPFAEMLEFIASCGGDVDTVSAMAGAIWGAANGFSALPAELLAKLEQQERLVQVAVALYERSSAL